MRILGVSAFYHDSAGALVEDGRVVAAAQEERFSRKKHDSRYPRHALECCLAEAGVRLSDVDYVAFYDKPLLKFERLLETLPLVRPSRLSVVPDGAAALAQREALSAVAEALVLNGLAKDPGHGGTQTPQATPAEPKS